MCVCVCVRAEWREEATYTRQLDAAVAALGSSAALLDVKEAELTTGSLDDSGPVGGGVVTVFPRTSITSPTQSMRSISPGQVQDGFWNSERGSTHGLRRR